MKTLVWTQNVCSVFDLKKASYLILVASNDTIIQWSPFNYRMLGSASPDFNTAKEKRVAGKEDRACVKGLA